MRDGDTFTSKVTGRKVIVIKNNKTRESIKLQPWDHNSGDRGDVPVEKGDAYEISWKQLLEGGYKSPGLCPHLWPFRRVKWSKQENSKSELMILTSKPLSAYLLDIIICGILLDRIGDILTCLIKEFNALTYICHPSSGASLSSTSEFRCLPLVAAQFFYCQQFARPSCSVTSDLWLSRLLGDEHQPDHRIDKRGKSVGGVHCRTAAVPSLHSLAPVHRSVQEEWLSWLPAAAGSLESVEYLFLGGRQLGGASKQPMAAAAVSHGNLHLSKSFYDPPVSATDSSGPVIVSFYPGCSNEDREDESNTVCACHAHCLLERSASSIIGCACVYMTTFICFNDCGAELVWLCRSDACRSKFVLVAAQVTVNLEHLSMTSSRRLR